MCLDHPSIGITLSLPAGGIIGLTVAMYGFIRLHPALNKLADAADTMGVDLSMVLENTDNVARAFFLSNIIVALYGFREKYRIRMNRLGHITSGGAPYCCCCCCPFYATKFFFKGVVSVAVLATLSAVLVLAVLMEAVYVLCWTIDAVCNTGQMVGQRTWLIFSLFTFHKLNLFFAVPGVSPSMLFPFHLRRN